MHRFIYLVSCLVFSLSVFAQDISAIANELSELKQEIAKLKMRESMSGLGDAEEAKLEKLLEKKEILEKQLSGK